MQELIVLLGFMDMVLKDEALSSPTLVVVRDWGGHQADILSGQAHYLLTALLHPFERLLHLEEVLHEQVQLLIDLSFVGSCGRIILSRDSDEYFK